MRTFGGQKESPPELDEAPQCYARIGPHRYPVEMLLGGHMRVHAAFVDEFHATMASGTWVETGRIRGLVESIDHDSGAYAKVIMRWLI